MVWRLFAMKLETAETMEGVALNKRAPYFYLNRDSNNASELTVT